MKKSLQWLIIVVISTSLLATFTLAGCKTTAEEENVEVVEEATEEVAEEITEETSEEVAPAEKITLHWAVAPWTQSEIDQVQEVIDKYTAKNPNIECEVDIIQGDEYIPKLTSLLAADALPDIFFTHSGWTEQFALDGISIDLKPYLESGDFAINLDNLDPAMVEICTATNGMITVLPRAMDVMLVFYNKDMFDEAGVEYPTKEWTYDDLIEKAKALTKDIDGDGNIDQWGYCWDKASPITYINGAIAEGYGDGSWDPSTSAGENQTEYPFNSSAAVKGWGYMLNGELEGYTMPQDVVAEVGGFINAFALGKVAMVTNARWGVPATREQLTDDWDVVVLPKGSTGVYGCNGGTAGYTVASTTKYPEEAIDLLLYIYSEEGMEAFVRNYGAVPPVNTLYDSPIWRDLPGPPYNNDAFVEAAEHMRPYPTNGWWREGNFNEAVRFAVDNFLLGADIQTSFDQAVEMFEQTLEDLRPDYE